jgi:alanyl-tRNA synthetase
MTAVKDIRRTFLDYFVSQGHTEVASSPLIPENDPTLMFVNSGMVQFKNVFTGLDKRDYTRATTSQKCVRAGGKHNDLENVGYTARHHTFFEMMGNFSFGDYFKEDAIFFAWELLTKHFDLPADKLLVTVHTTDTEAPDIWKKVTGFGDDKIIRIPTDDNFWRMGDTGPCGPCTEIFFDHGDHIWGGVPGSPEEDGDRFIEIWNNVFMQYEQRENDRIDLPQQSIDTGMGLERIAAILQGVHSNYEIDLMQGLIHDVANKLSTDPNHEKQKASHQVIADHLRSTCFLMADGVMPSNEGRGYVLRRIMRRAMRHAHILGAQDPLMHQLVPELINQMGEAYPELKSAESLMTETLKLEETRFKKTLERGLSMLDDEAIRLGEGGTLEGEKAFKLYDTFGFPVDLTADALKVKNIEVDMDGFNTSMEAAKAKARASWSGAGGEADETVWFEVEEKFGATEFLGYERETCEAEILCIVKDGKIVDALANDETGFIVTNQSPFYAESGGQVGDTGTFIAEKGNANVTNTLKKLGKVWAHQITVTNGSLNTGDAVEMKIDTDRRAAVESNHSVTHLLHEALRQALGDHVAQKGSLQDDTRTRFDIAHPKGITAEELQKVEADVNAEIAANTPVVTRIMDLDDAKESGARALFGEKYDAEVHVVSMGQMGADHAYSVELCGGTHVKQTGDIAKFKIISESAVSAGVRRIEAITGARVDAYIAEQESNDKAELEKYTTMYNELSSELTSLGGSVDAPDLTDIESIRITTRKIEKQVSDLRRQQGTQTSDDDVKDIAGIKYIGKILDGFAPQDLKPMADTLKAQIGSGVVALVAVNDGKASIVVGVTNDLTDKINAVDLVRTGSAALGGKGGGGRPDMAQAGGPDGSAANDAVASIEGQLAG